MDILIPCAGMAQYIGNLLQVGISGKAYSDYCQIRKVERFAKIFINARIH